MKKRVLILIVCLVVCALFLQALPGGVNATVDPTSIGLTEFAVKAYNEGWGYVYGTYGQFITQAVLDGKASQYPSVFSTTFSDGTTAYQNSQKWVGRRAVDCVGLMKAYVWWQGNSSNPYYTASQDQSANGLYNSATVKGDISTIPETHGLLVWRDGHIGVYIGNGWVIESRGCQYGVVKTRLSDRGWTNWCQYPLISYTANGWTSIFGQTCYYRDGCFVTGLQVIDSKTFLFDNDGFLLTGFNIVAGTLRYFLADGSQLTGWQTIDGARYYLNADSTASTGWTVVDGQSRLFSPDGVLLSGWQLTENGIVFLSSEGVAQTGSQTIAGITYEFNADGILMLGWQQKDTGWYYYDGLNRLVTGLQLIDGRVFLFDAAGVRLIGWQTIDGRDYYFDLISGAAAAGLKIIDGQPLLFAADGSLIKTAGLSFNGDKTYLTDASGLALTGSQTLAGISLQFADDFTLQMQTTAAFALQPSAAVLNFAAASSTASQLTITGTLPEGDLPVTWTSLDPAVATVSPTGLVTAAGIGQTVIVLQTASGAYAACQVAVLPDPAALTTADAVMTLEPGRSVDLNISSIPVSLLSAGILTSTNPTVATVDAYGRVTAVSNGTASIKISYAGSEIVVQNFVVAQPLLALSVSRTTLTLPIGATVDSFVTRIPADSVSAITYSSTAPTVAAVDSDGRISGLTQGSALITAAAGDLSVSCTVSVTGYYPNLRRGSSDEYVKQLQQRLSDLGYLVGAADGSYGPMTEFAVNCFQQKLSLPLTGVADHNLQAALQADTAPQATAVQQAGTLRVGDTGETVFTFQQRLSELNFLKATPTGAFDSLTLTAMQNMQNVNGLSQTDFTDAATINTLYSRKVIAGKSTLLLGDTGCEVLALQTRLMQLGYYTGSLDSQFNTSVEQAVINFQMIAGLTVDGHAGANTQRALYADSATPYSPEAMPAVPTILSAGSTGSEVMTLESRLVALGYHLAVADLTYNSLTSSSVAAFQRRAGLPQTGIADLKSQNRLYADNAPRSSAAYKFGNSGAAVALIQQRLNDRGFLCGTADGRFGNKTLAAVKKFQRSAGLTADGSVGPATIASLFAPAAAPVVVPAVTTVVTLPVDTAPSATLARILQYGSRGDDVVQVQRQLNNLGYSCGTADGKFGPKTKAAVKSFQSSYGLPANGIVDSQTFSYMCGLTATPPVAPKVSVTTSTAKIFRTLKYGNSGNDVRILQQRLNDLGYACGMVDGHFGNRTLAAVKAFQRRAGLTVDGSVGPGTTAALFLASAPYAG